MKKALHNRQLWSIPSRKSVMVPGGIKRLSQTLTQFTTCNLVHISTAPQEVKQVGAKAKVGKLFDRVGMGNLI